MRKIMEKNINELSEQDLLDLDIDKEMIKEFKNEFIDFMDDQEIHEALKTSLTRIDRSEKLNRLSGSMAARIAKSKNDPDYKKMIKYKALWKKFKDKVMRKYKSRGKQAARKATRK